MSKSTKQLLDEAGYYMEKTNTKQSLIRLKKNGDEKWAKYFASTQSLVRWCIGRGILRWDECLTVEVNRAAWIFFSSLQLLGLVCHDMNNENLFICLESISKDAKKCNKQEQKDYRFNDIINKFIKDNNLGIDKIKWV